MPMSRGIITSMYFVEAGLGVFPDNRTLLLDFQLAP